MSDTPAADDGQALAHRFEEANEKAIACVLGPAAAVWQETTDREGWPVGFVARHIANWHERLVDWLRDVKFGRPIEPPDADAINLREAQEGIDASPADVATLLRLHGKVVAAALRDLDSDALAGEVLFGGDPTPARQICEVVVGHVDGHRASIEAVIAGHAEPS